MKIARLRFLTLLAAVPAGSWAAPIPLEDPLTNPGFVHFYNNEYDQALSVFETALKSQAGDPEAYNHIAQALLYREMFHNGALESELVSGTNPFLRRPKLAVSNEDKGRFNECIDKALKLSNRALQKDPNDLSALYSRAVAHGFRANYLFLVEKAWVDALKETTAGRKDMQRIVELDPKCVDARLGLGLHDYVVGSLPFYMRAVGLVAGFHGDREQGIRELEDVRQHGVLNRYDAEILLAAIYRRERRPRQAIPLLKEVAARFPRNYLFRYEQVQMFSDLGDKSAALQVLNEVENLQKAAAPGYRDVPLEKTAYLRGNLLFWYGDLEPALTELKQVTSHVQALDLGTAVMAWLRLGQVCDLKGDHAEAIQAYRQTIAVAPQSEAAGEAKGYIANPYRRKRSS